jgi:hypothetical protein
LRQHVPNTGRISIDDTNRNFNYVLSLDPPPAPRTFNASYQYLGKWYELRDDGTGLLVGDGSGQINYLTGSIILTLQAQPDASSVIFYRWTEPGIYSTAVAESFVGSTQVYLSMAKTTVIPGTVSIEWVSGGVTRTATDAADNGVVAGDATGTVIYGSGSIALTNSYVPDAGTSWLISYDYKDTTKQTAIVTVPDNDDQSDIVLATVANIQPGSMSFTLRKSIPREVRDENNILLSRTYGSEFHAISDNGAGHIINRRTNAVVGTINYSTGQVIVVGDAFLKMSNS